MVKALGRNVLLTLSKFYLKNDFFSIEGQYELEWKLRKNRNTRRAVLWLSQFVGKKQTYYSLLKIDREQKFLESLHNGRSVKRGAFKGMTYPSLESYGSVLAAKLLGSYEHELEAAVAETLQKTYEHVLDIGCAEGYYAVGYALRLPTTHLHAFDINQEALSRCKEMASINKVSDRFMYYEQCTAEFLNNFDFSQPCLIISDCEGYEAELFTPEVVARLATCDLLIEVHEKLRPGVTDALADLFLPTHQLQLIRTEKRAVSDYPELASFPDTEKHLILYELRNEFEEYLQNQHFNQWLYITARG